MMGPKETCKVKTREVIRKCDWSIDALWYDVHSFPTKNDLGCWFVTPSMEQKNGGAYYCDLACHQEENDSLQIICMAGSHYGMGYEYPKKGEK